MADEILTLKNGSKIKLVDNGGEPYRGVAEVFHPGEYIGDEMQERGWDIVTLATAAGLPTPTVTSLVFGRINRASVTPDIAKGLARAFGTSAALWTNLQVTYDKYRKAQEDKL